MSELKKQEPGAMAKQKSPAKKSPPKTPRGKTATPRKQTAPAKPAPRRKPATSVRPRKTAPAQPAVALGRPKITGEEKLYLLFKEDYHARQIFDFLGVETVKELEQLAPQEIVRRLSQPITSTVDRIRRKLAEKNRCLHDDQPYAAKHQPGRDD